MKTIGLLILSNCFMTVAWYWHLKATDVSLWKVILISWGIALFEYMLQVPANRLGSNQYGGPFSLIELKVIQEVVSLSVFSLVAVYLFKTEKFTWNHLIGFAFLVLAVYFIFKK